MIYGNRWLKDTTNNTTISESFSIVADEYLNRLSMLEACTDDDARPILEAQVEVLHEISFKDIIEKLKQLWEKFKNWIKNIWDTIFHNDRVAEAQCKKAEDKAKEAADEFIKEMEASADKEVKASAEFYDKFKTILFKININDEGLDDKEKEELERLITLSKPIKFSLRKDNDDTLITPYNEFIFNFIKRKDTTILKEKKTLLDAIRDKIKNTDGLYTDYYDSKVNDNMIINHYKEYGNVYNAVHITPVEVPMVTSENHGGVFIMSFSNDDSFKPKKIDPNNINDVKQCLLDLIKSFRKIHSDIDNNIDRLDQLKKDTDKDIKELNDFVEKLHNLKHSIITDIQDNKKIAISSMSTRAADWDMKDFMEAIDSSMFKNETVEFVLQVKFKKFYRYLVDELSYTSDKINDLTKNELVNLFREYHKNVLKPEKYDNKAEYDDIKDQYMKNKYSAHWSEKPEYHDFNRSDYKNMNHNHYGEAKRKMERFKELIMTVKECITVTQKKSKFIVKNRIGYIKGKQYLTNTMVRLITYMDKEYKMDETGEYKDYNEV